MADDRLILDYVLDHRSNHPRQVFLTQPVGGGRVIDYSWDDVVDQALRMANHLRLYGFEPDARIAILSKNCAHFIMAELAIWMAGGTTVAIFPTETADVVRYVLEHSESSLLFRPACRASHFRWRRPRRSTPGTRSSRAPSRCRSVRDGRPMTWPC
jgi:long-chain acyl-CoA synthetase